MASHSSPEELRFIDHISIGVTNLHASLRFYDAVLCDALGAERIQFRGYGYGYGFGNPSLWLIHEELPPASGHICFRAPDQVAVGRFHAAGLKAGGKDAGAPGPRPEYGEHYFTAYLLDPDGTRVEAAVGRPAGEP